MACLRLRIVNSTQRPGELSLRLTEEDATATTLIHALKDAGFEAGETALLITEDTTMDVQQLANEALENLKREVQTSQADALELRNDITGVAQRFFAARWGWEDEQLARDLANNLVEALRLKWDFAKVVIR